VHNPREPEIVSEDKTTLRAQEKATSESPRASLVLYHRDGAKVAPLAPGSSLVVGRSHPADIVLADPSLSRKHARISWDDDGFHVEDLGSTNGTRLGGAKIVARTRVAPADAITFGDVVAALQVLSPDDRETSGIDGYDRFLAAVDEEVTRARTFARPFALAMVRGEGHLRLWSSSLRAALRPVDRMGSYGEGAVLVLFPELAQPSLPSELRVGLARFPEDGGSVEELVDVARRALRTGRTSEPPPSSAVVASPRMREVYDTVARVGPSALPILVQGETGAGKEIIARAIHDASPRRRGPMRSLNCAAIPATLLEGMLFGHERGAFTGADRVVKGVFEQAASGTVFLDEIGELAPAAQAALLRVLETKKVTRLGSDREVDVDVRIVAATHRHLESMCEAGTFRWDLLYRLNAITLQLPPLRERREEILPLAELFLREANKENGRAIRGIDPRAASLLQKFRWPGNVRELRNVIERAVVIARGDTIAIEDLPEKLRGEATPTSAPPKPSDAQAALKDRMRTFEIEQIVAALEAHAGNQTEAARALGLPVRTLAHKIQTYGIKKKFSAR
jgi:DNA-binding NtrC family response regulator